LSKHSFLQKKLQKTLNKHKPTNIFFAKKKLQKTLTKHQPTNFFLQQIQKMRLNSSSPIPNLSNLTTTPKKVQNITHTYPKLPYLHNKAGPTLQQTPITNPCKHHKPKQFQLNMHDPSLSLQKNTQLILANTTSGKLLTRESP
jgi:hypothetical protein